MSRHVILDTGPLVALLVAREEHHDWAREQFATVTAPLPAREPVTLSVPLEIVVVPVCVAEPVRVSVRNPLTTTLDAAVWFRSPIEMSEPLAEAANVTGRGANVTVPPVRVAVGKETVMRLPPLR